MNLGNLITEAQRLAGRVDSNFNERTRRWINEAQNEWAISVPWPTLERSETFIANGTRTLVLPARIQAVRWVGDKSNKAEVLPNRFWNREYPSQYHGQTAGSATYWRDGGVVAVAQQPAAASQIYLDTPISDSFSVYVAGLARDSNASGTANEYYFKEEEISVTGSGPHTSVNTYVQVDVVGKDDLTPGDVVLHDSATNVLARIAANQYRPEYRTIEFLLVPAAGTEISIGYTVRPAELAANYQVPHPSVDTEYLVWYAASLIHSAQGQEDQAQIKRQHAEAIIQRRIYKERMHGEKDLRAIPEANYWNDEDQYIVPEA